MARMKEKNALAVTRFTKTHTQIHTPANKTELLLWKCNNKDTQVEGNFKPRIWMPGLLIDIQYV